MFVEPRLLGSRTPAGCYVPVMTSGSRGHIAPLRGATLRRTFSTNIAHLRCALHRPKPVHCTARRCPTGFKPVVSAIPHARLASGKLHGACPVEFHVTSGAVAWEFAGGSPIDS